MLRAALDTSLDLATDLIKIAWKDLQEMRISGDSNAACLVRCLAGVKASEEDSYINRVAKLIKEVTGCTDNDIEVVHSGIDGSTDKIKNFKKSNKMFLISIRQISEGVDIPRLRVLLHLDNTKTELTLRQELGRVTRWESDHDKRQYAIMVMPNIPTYMQFAKCIQDDVAESVREEEDQEPEERGCLGEGKERLVTLYAEMTGISSVMSGEVHDHENPLIKEAQVIKATLAQDVSLELISAILRAREGIIKNNNIDDEFSKENLAALNEMPMVKTIPNDELSKVLRKELSNNVSRILHINKKFEKHKDVYNKIYEIYQLKTPDNFKGSPIKYIERKDGIDGLKRCIKISHELMEMPA